MKSIVQALVGFVVSGLVGEQLFGTPLYNQYTIAPIFIAAMYVTALAQHRWQFRKRRLQSRMAAGSRRQTGYASKRY